MISLKNSKTDSEAIDYEAPMYHWGSAITLEKEHLDQLGLDVSVGDEVTITGKAIVSNHSEHDNLDSESHESMGFQFTDIEIKPAKSDRAGLLYGDD